MTILDNDRAGVLKFTEEVFIVRPDQKKAKVTIKRFDGADGIATCSVSTRIANHICLEGFEALQPGVEFEPIED